MTATDLLFDGRGIFQDFPTETAIIGGREFRCIVLDVTSRNQWADGGLLDMPDASIGILRTDLPITEAEPPIAAITTAELPAQGDTIEFRSVEWAVDAVHSNHAHSPVRIDLTRRVR